MIGPVRKLWLYATGVAGLSGSDVILASYPKSGNTWMRFLFCNVVSLLEWDGRTVDHGTVDATMPELGVDNLLVHHKYNCIPRMVKTHRRYIPLFARNKSVYIHRDPRDTLVSYFHFVTDRPSPLFAGELSEFVRHPRFGINSLLAHRASWIDRATATVSYEGLKKDGVDRFKEVLARIELDLPDEIVNEAFERSRFERVRELEEKTGHPKLGKAMPEVRFAREGRVGGWRERFSDSDCDYVAAACERAGLSLTWD